MKRKLNLVGNTFTHLTNGNKGYLQSSGRSSADIFPAINDGINDGRKGPKYLWLLESKYIKQGLVESIIANQQLVEDTYDTIFTHDQRLLALGDKYKWVPAQGFWIKEPKIYEKSKMISMISSNKRMCEGHVTRLDWVDRIGDQVDLYGRGFNEIVDKEEGLCDYMFSVAIENGQYETYFTEKILDCFATGTIPVYLGAPDIGKHFNTDGIITLSEEFDVSEDIYNDKLDAIQDNLERVKKMEILEDFIWENYFE